MKEKNKFVNGNGDFELPSFLYHTIMSLMKSTLDLGTLSCSNQHQLRAYKETVKKNFKGKWKEIAEVLLALDLISPCSCSETDYCEICNGARFTTNSILNSDFVTQLFVFTSDDMDDETRQKLEEGLIRAQKEAEPYL